MLDEAGARRGRDHVRHLPPRARGDQVPPWIEANVAASSASTSATGSPSRHRRACFPTRAGRSARARCSARAGGLGRRPRRRDLLDARALLGSPAGRSRAQGVRERLGAIAPSSDAVELDALWEFGDPAGSEDRFRRRRRSRPRRRRRHPGRGADAARPGAGASAPIRRGRPHARRRRSRSSAGRPPGSHPARPRARAGSRTPPGDLGPRGGVVPQGVGSRAKRTRTAWPSTRRTCSGSSSGRTTPGRGTSARWRSCSHVGRSRRAPLGRLARAEHGLGAPRRGRRRWGDPALRGLP